MRVVFLGSGDAFGSGGRLATCILVDRGQDSFLVDCGMSAMIALRRCGVDPNSIAAIVISHLHGDHFGGLPFFILDAQYVSRRQRPLLVAGPPGLEARLHALMEACFPGSSRSRRAFALELVELAMDGPSQLGERGPSVVPWPVRHPSGAPSLALRIACDRWVLAYSGDTEWVDDLAELGRGADLLITECYTYDRAVPYHMNYVDLAPRLATIAAKRVILTHMSEEMLARSAEVDAEMAYDGLAVELG